MWSLELSLDLSSKEQIVLFLVFILLLDKLVLIVINLVFNSSKSLLNI